MAAVDVRRETGRTELDSSVLFQPVTDHSDSFAFRDCERKGANLDAAIADCQKALTYDAKDPFAHYGLGLAFMTKAINTGSIAELDPAIQHFQQMIAINPAIAEADIARKNIANIRQFLKQPR